MFTLLLGALPPHSTHGQILYLISKDFHNYNFRGNYYHLTWKSCLAGVVHHWPIQFMVRAHAQVIDSISSAWCAGGSNQWFSSLMFPSEINKYILKVIYIHIFYIYILKKSWYTLVLCFYLLLSSHNMVFQARCNPFVQSHRLWLSCIIWFLSLYTHFSVILLLPLCPTYWPPYPQNLSHSTSDCICYLPGMLTLKYITKSFLDNTVKTSLFSIHLITAYPKGH